MTSARRTTSSRYGLAPQSFLTRVERLAEEFPDLPLMMVVRAVVTSGERIGLVDVETVCRAARRELVAERALVVRASHDHSTETVDDGVDKAVAQASTGNVDLR